MSGRGRSGSGRSQRKGGGRGGRGSPHVGGGQSGGGGQLQLQQQQQQRQSNTRSAPPTPTKDQINSRAGTPASYINNVRSSAPRGRTSLHNDATASVAPSSKKDGERGASAHTVSEQYRIQLTQLLINFRETTSNQDSITLQSNLTNTQRKFVHELSKQLGLKSKSHGKGEERKVVVSKILCVGGSSGVMSMFNNTGDGSSSSCTNTLPALDKYKQVPRVNVGKSGEEALRKHITQYPPSVEEEAESRETGSSYLLMKKINCYEQNDANKALLQPCEDGGKGDEGTTTEKVVLNDELAHLALNDDTSTLLAQSSEYSRRQDNHYRKEKYHHTKIITSRMQNHALSRQQTLSHPQYAKMMKQRRNLPAFRYAQDICNVLRNKSNQVVILTGDTGCG